MQGILRNAEMTHSVNNVQLCILLIFEIVILTKTNTRPQQICKCTYYMLKQNKDDLKVLFTAAQANP